MYIYINMYKYSVYMYMFNIYIYIYIWLDRERQAREPIRFPRVFPMAGKVSRILISLCQEFAQVGPEYPNVVDWEKGLLQTSSAYSAYFNAVSLSKKKFVIACGVFCCSPCLNFLTHMSRCCSIVFLYTNMRAFR